MSDSTRLTKATDVTVSKSEQAYDSEHLGFQFSGAELQVLEPRVLLDAAGYVTAADAVDHAEAEQTANNIDAVLEGKVAAPWTAERTLKEQALFAPDLQISNQSVEYAFIDSKVEDIGTLLASFDDSVQVYILEPNDDGVEQIAAILDGQTNIDAVHILSHGRSGTLELGSTKLTEASMESHHADELATIRNALSNDADILIYGCDFARGTRGEGAVATLANLTGADVAASDDLTGSSALGGDWELESQVGEITAIALAPTNWASTLDLSISNVGVGGVAVTGASVDALAQQILGSGVSVTSAAYSGGADQAATFVTGAGSSFGSDILTFNDGAIFSSGTAVSVAGPNNATSFTVDAPGIDGDSEFDALAGNNTFDASFLEISFTPDVPPGASVGDTGRMTMEIVFGSDEYNEYVYGGVNDTLAVIVNGANQAVVPNGLPIGIDTINDAGTFNPAFGNPLNDPNPEHTAAGFESAAASLYTNNDTNAFNTQMDGFTITVPVTFDVIVGQSNTIKIGIADTGDAAFDSWMFVKADSAQTVIVAESDSVSTPTDVPFNIDVTANDYDLQGDALSVTHILGQAVNPGDTITLTSGVDVTLEIDGTLTVEGDGTNTANDAFTYSITDGNGGTSTAFVGVNITAPNSAPVAADDVEAVNEDGTLSDSVLSNNGNGPDTDFDGDALTVTEVNGANIVSGGQINLPSGALLNMNSDGSYTYDPNGQFETLAVGDTATDTFTYLVTDPHGATDTATVTINIAGANDAPVAQNDDESVDEDTVLAENVLSDNGNGVDGDLDGDSLSVSQVNGIVADVGSQITLASGALLTVNPDGSYAYDPNGQFEDLNDGEVGADSFDYTITDGNGGSSTATVSITIDGVADAPTLNLDPDNDSGTPTDPSDDGIDDGSYETTFNENDMPVGIVDTDMTITDPEDDIVEVVITLTNGQSGDMFNFPNSLPGNVSASVSPAATLSGPGVVTVTFTGDATTTEADWNAILQAVSFNPSTDDVHNPNPADRNVTIVATDSELGASQLLETVVHVVPVNDPPTLDLDDDDSGGINAGNYQGTYVENGAGAPISSGVVITDLDSANLENMTITLTNGEIGDILNIGALPAGISLVGAAPSELTSTGTIVVQLTGSASLSDYQAAIAAVTISSTSENPTAGVREITVVGSDGDDNSPTRTAFITVEPVNDAPIAQDPAAPGVEADAMPTQSGEDSSSLSAFNAAPYFSDPDDTVLTYSLGPDTPLWMTIDGQSGEIAGTPPSDASQNTNVMGNPDGTYTVTVVATDALGLSADTTIDYEISNPAPIAVADAFQTLENATQLSENVLAANPTTLDADPDGDPIALTEVNGSALNVGSPVSGDAGGIFIIQANGDLVFDDNNEFEDLAVGETRDTIVTHTIDDGNGGTDRTTVTVTVTGTNDGPIPVDPTQPTGPLDPTDPVDPDDPHVPPTDPLNYIPQQTAQDSAPVSPIDLTPYFGDPDATEVPILSIDPADLPSGVTFNPMTNTISGTPASDASQQGDPGTPGTYTVAVTATDPNDPSLTFTTNITYVVTNPAPIAEDDAVVANEDAVLSGSVFDANGTATGDTDPDGDVLMVTQSDGDPANVGQPVAGSDGGTFTINSDGSYEFNPELDFNDLPLGDTRTTTITYQVSDGEGGFDEATVTVTVEGRNDGPIPVDPTQPTGPLDPTDPVDPDDPHVPPTDPLNYIPQQTAQDSAPVSPIDLTPYFGDPDATEVPILSIDPADLPSGVTFNPMTNTISGTPASDASQQGDPGTPGTYTVAVTATDPNDPSLTFTTNITYVVTNPAPIVVSALPDHEGLDGFGITLETASHFDDIDNDVLSFSAVGLPIGLSIDSQTGEISGTLDGNASNGGPNGDGFYNVVVMVDDGEGGTVSTPFVFEAKPVPFSALDEPFEPSLDIDPLVSPELIPGGLLVNDATNQFSDFGPNTALGDDLVMTNVINEFSSLGGDTALMGSHPISEALHNMIETDRQTGLGPDLIGRDELGDLASNPYIGGQVEALLKQGDANVFMRTVIWQKQTYVDLMTFGDVKVIDWTVQMRSGGSVPEWIRMPGQSVVLIERIANIENVQLTIGAQLPNGAVEYFPISINLESGDITLIEENTQTSQTNSATALEFDTASGSLTSEIQRMASSNLLAARSLFRI